MDEHVERFRVVGHVRVDPPLRGAEFEYLTAFAESRRWQRPDGPYAVPGNPIAECLDPDLDLGSYAVPADGQPGLRCPWAPAHGGRALVPSEGVGGTGHPPAEVAAWLAYLRDHFLRPHAHAARCGGSTGGLFAGFGFDHVLDGAAAVCGERSGEVTVIRIGAGDLSTEVVAHP